MTGRTRWRTGPSVTALVAVSFLCAVGARAQTGAPADQGAPALAAVAPAGPLAPLAAGVPGGAVSARQAASPAAALAPVAGALEGAPAQIPQSRVRNYVHDLTGVGAILGVLGGAAIDQMSNRPVQWGSGFSGFADRVASHAGALVVGETVHHGLAYEMNETTQYQLCGCRDFSMQAEHAFEGAVTDIDLNTGRRVVSVPRIAGAFAGSFAPMIWQPGYTAGNALVGGALSLVASGVFNLADELLHNQSVVAAAQRSR